MAKNMECSISKSKPSTMDGRNTGPQTRREEIWLALSDLFAGSEVEYRYLARVLHGEDMATLRDICFDEVAPVCAPNLMAPVPPVWPGFSPPSLFAAIRDSLEQRRASRFAAFSHRLRRAYLHLRLRDLWREAEKKINRSWNSFAPTPRDVADMAHKAMLMEARASPKPGLVCPDHNGSHTDMDYPLFVASAGSLRPYLLQCVAIGRETRAQTPGDVFPLLRAAGCEAEKVMFAATGGVNTHKGQIFSLGLLCAACGRRLARGLLLDPDCVAADAAAFVRGIVARDLERLKAALPDRKLTAGEKLYLEHGATGVRGEAEQAFPTALAAFRTLRDDDADRPLALSLPQSLLRILAGSADTNLLSRGGAEGLAYARLEARKALEKGGMYTEEGRAAVLAMRDEFPRRNLSPGGSADLLAVCVFFLLLAHAPDGTGHADLSPEQ